MSVPSTAKTAQSGDMENLRRWIGRAEERHAIADLQSMTQLHATLDRADAKPKLGDDVPPCWHWMWFNPAERWSVLGPDGHPEKGGFLPPVPLPRRMWAGSRLTQHRPIKVGEPIRKRSEITDVSERIGKTGRLIFVVQKLSIFAGDELCVEEDYDAVYREAANEAAGQTTPPEAPSGGQWSRLIDPDPVLLFRYSAVTFNGHRIHYDHPYVTKVEGYPGLIVHGPLTATLLMELARDSNPGKRIASYAFRAVSPLYAVAPFSVNGKLTDKGALLWAANPQGRLAMQAEVRFA
jgi:3-methylfumaryl-CoA hydratase